MKTAKSIVSIIIIFSLLATNLFSQDRKQENKLKSTSIKNMVDSQNFVFVALTVLPMRGMVKTLTSYYDVKISKDNIVCNLPYFGRAYMAPMDPANAGLSFTSSKFTYWVSQNKKGWDVKIKFSDQVNVSQLYFTIFSNGSASLNVTSINLDPITFEGNVIAGAQAK